MVKLSRRVAFPGALALVAGLALVAVSHPSDAKATWDSPYSLEQTFNAATRLVRVDLGLKITERDPQAAYLMFDYRNVETGKKVSPGSIELTPTRGGVRVVVQLGELPRYHEQVLADRLAQKMRADYGPPPERPKARDVDDGGAPDAPAD